MKISIIYFFKNFFFFFNKFFIFLHENFYLIAVTFRQQFFSEKSVSNCEISHPTATFAETWVKSPSISLVGQQKSCRQVKNFLLRSSFRAEKLILSSHRASAGD